MTMLYSVTKSIFIIKYGESNLSVLSSSELHGFTPFLVYFSKALPFILHLKETRSLMTILRKVMNALDKALNI